MLQVQCKIVMVTRLLERLIISLGTVDNKYLFTGEQYDNNVGFYYLRARYYNQNNGRFVNLDVFQGLQFEPITLHKYLYANGNPANIIDPSGNVGFGEFFSCSEDKGISSRICSCKN